MGARYHPHDIGQELEGCCLDCEAGLHTVKQHILAFHERIADFSPDTSILLTFEEVREMYAELDDVVRLYGPSDSLVTALVADEEVAAVLPDLRKAYATYFQLHEKDYAQRVLSADDPWSVLEEFAFYPNYCSLVDAEVRLAGLQKGEHAVFIGCGPLPLTNLLLAARHGLRSTALEEDEDLVALAREVVSRLGLDGHVEVVWGDHTWLTGDTHFDLVSVAAQADPRPLILEHVSRTATPDTRILLRIYQKGLRRILAGDEGLTLHLPEDMRVIETMDPGPNVNNTIVLLEVSG